MPVRKINKQDRVKLVKWMRSGAPLDEGVSLFASVTNNARLLIALQKNPVAFEKEMHLEICTILGITYVKFHNTIKKFNGNKKIKPVEARNINRKTERKIRIENRSGKFRSDWPFLSDPTCPPELKALAADKISCWERYRKNHENLFDCSSLKECAETAHEIIKDFKENRLIHQEFDHYLKTGSILGLHPVFDHYKRFKKLRGLSIIDQIKEKERIKHRIWRIQSEIAKANKPHLRAKREASLNEAESELAEINRMLGIDG